MSLQSIKEAISDYAYNHGIVVGAIVTCIYFAIGIIPYTIWAATPKFYGDPNNNYNWMIFSTLIWEGLGILAAFGWIIWNSFKK